MKRIGCLILILCVSVIFASCDEMNNIILNNMSDLRVNYYEGQNDIFYASLSCGYREQEFAYDGISTTPIECGVITLEFFAESTYKSVAIILNVQGVEKECILERSPYENIYMEDIGEIVNQEYITIKLKNTENIAKLNMVSNYWTIDYKKAISTAQEYFREELTSLYFNNKLNAECYLKIIFKKEFENRYYYFSIIDRAGNNYSCLIDVSTGNIISNAQN